MRIISCDKYIYLVRWNILLQINIILWHEPSFWLNIKSNGKPVNKELRHNSINVHPQYSVLHTGHIYDYSSYPIHTQGLNLVITRLQDVLTNDGARPSAAAERHTFFKDFWANANIFKWFFCCSDDAKLKYNDIWDWMGLLGAMTVNSLNPGDFMHSSVGWIIISSGNGLAPDRCQAITWTDNDFQSIKSSATNFS